MTLTQAQFETLVTNLERYAQQKPVSYTIRVGLLAALGYVYIFFVLGVILRVLISIIHFILYTNVINAVTLKLAVAMIIPLFVIARVILRSLWVSFPKPQGLKIHRQDAPKLFDMVDELTTKLKAPRFHHILLTEEFNAAVVQIPRLGLLGWQQNYLLLGLPLMQGLSSVQFGSVLAHELGHLSGNHSRFAGWIYRIQKTYSQIFQRLQENENLIGYWIMEFFFKWYTPFFSAYSFVLRRMNEYEADQCAMQLLGAKNTAEALINFQIKSKLLNNFFWQNIYKQAHESTEPPTNVYTEMSKVLLTSSKQEDSGRFLQECLAERTDFHDTHPSLRDRLKALGYLQKNSQELKIPSQFSVSAGREYLGNSLPKYIKYFEQVWCNRMQVPWLERYNYAQEALEKLTSLEERMKNQSLRKNQKWELAYWTYEFRSEDAAIPILEEILTDDVNHLSANYLLGQILLRQDNLRGVKYIEKAISQDSNIVVEGCSLMYAFFKKQGNLKLAHSYQERIYQYYQ